MGSLQQAETVQGTDTLAKPVIGSEAEEREEVTDSIQPSMGTAEVAVPCTLQLSNSQ